MGPRIGPGPASASALASARERQLPGTGGTTSMSDPRLHCPLVVLVLCKLALLTEAGLQTQIRVRPPRRLLRSLVVLDCVCVLTEGGLQTRIRARPSRRLIRTLVFLQCAKTSKTAGTTRSLSLLGCVLHGELVRLCLFSHLRGGDTTYNCA